MFPLRERLRFRDSFGLALLELRARSIAFRGLAKGPWALFIAIGVHWQGNAEAWPSQDALARFSGWSTRSVRDHADTLARGGFVRLRRERRADGSERIFYAPGLVTLAELAAFVERYPRERAKSLGPPPIVKQAPLSPTPPEAISGGPPEGIAMELRDQDQIGTSSCDVRRFAPAVPEEQQGGRIGEEDWETAHEALAQRMRRKYPTRPPPRWFDARDIAIVATCSEVLGGDREAKRRAHRDAIEGAFLVSREGPPTVRFVWGKVDHFLDHVERGRRRRLAAERAANDATDVGAHAAAVEHAAPAAVAASQVSADLERLFGAGWRAHAAR